MSIRDEHLARLFQNRKANAGQIRFVFLPPSEGRVKFYAPQLECAACDVMLLWDSLGWWYCAECGTKIPLDAMPGMLRRVEYGLHVLKKDVKYKQGGHGLLWFLAKLFGKSKLLPP